MSEAQKQLIEMAIADLTYVRDLCGNVGGDFCEDIDKRVKAAILNIQDISRFENSSVLFN